MADTHSKIMRQVQLDWSRENRGRLFPNQIGIARQGKAIIKYGLRKGSSDLVGWEFNKLSPIYPVFCCVEVKTIASPKLSKEQIAWLNAVVTAGGRAYVAREFAITEKTHDRLEPSINWQMYDGYYLEEWKTC